MPRQYKQIHFVLGQISLFFHVQCPSISSYLSYLVTHFYQQHLKMQNFDFK